MYDPFQQMLKVDKARAKASSFGISRLKITASEIITRIYIIKKENPCAWGGLTIMHKEVDYG